MHYVARYEERHPSLTDANEAAMVNSYEPKRCPFCQSEKIVKIGYDPNGIRRLNVHVERNSDQLQGQFLIQGKSRLANGLNIV